MDQILGEVGKALAGFFGSPVVQFAGYSIVVYLVLGWQGLFLAPSLFTTLPAPATALIVTGGVLYTAGAAFHLWTRLPFHAAIWHGLVVLAAGCHYAAIWQAVVQAVVPAVVPGDTRL